MKFKRIATILCALVLCLTVAGCKVALYSNLTEREANDMMASLMAAGISAEKLPGEEGMWILNVEEDHFADAVDRLNSAGLPRDDFANMGEVFKKEGLISSPLEERVRFIYALSQELAKTISQVDGVISSRVHVVLPDNNPFADETKPSSAAVFVKHRQDSEVDSLIPQIKRLVVDSIEGLSYDKVTVVLVPAEDMAETVKAPPMVTLLGVRMPTASVGSFWTLTGGLVVLVIAGFGAAAWLFVARRRVAGGADASGAADSGAKG